MSVKDEALLFACDEAACHEDPMFYEVFTMDDRWMIIRKILDAAVQSGKLADALSRQRIPSHDDVDEDDDQSD